MSSEFTSERTTLRGLTQHMLEDHVVAKKFPSVPKPGSLSDETPSEKSYATSVILSSVFGLVGLHHFYLGRWLEGVIDLALSVGWMACLVLGKVPLAILFLVLDFGHALISTILLLTGNYRDGVGRRVCYPGQKLNTRIGG